MPSHPSVTPAAAAASPLRSFARFELRQLVGRSMTTMLWSVVDPQHGGAVLLALPRSRAPDADKLDGWLQAARKTARLEHPQLAKVIEVGHHEQWPYIVCEAVGVPLAERFAALGAGPQEAARWIAEALDGLAFAHDAGLLHGDLQPHFLQIGDDGRLRVVGLQVAPLLWGDGSANAQMDTAQLQAQRRGAARDVVAAGCVLHQLLAGAPPLDEADIGRAIDRLPPQGREILRLPFTLPRPVADGLRAIVNRATDTDERRRYQGARSLARALLGWIEADSAQDGDPHARLLQRIAQHGVLPALPGGAMRAVRLASSERGHTGGVAEAVLRDPALAFELLRAVNSAHVRASQLGGGSTVLTLRRAIAMLGLDGLRRAAEVLKPWPGVLDEARAPTLQAAVLQAKRAARLAQAIRPAGYDAEVVYLVALLQNLGRLVVRYHHAEEAEQIHRLMWPQEEPAPAVHGEQAAPAAVRAMSEEAASYAVLGWQTESIGVAVARQWGLDESAQHMLRRLPVDTPVRHADGDEDMLRAVASCANECIDALWLRDALRGPALAKIAQRYARLLGLAPRELQQALQEAARSDGAPLQETQPFAVDESPQPKDPLQAAQTQPNNAKPAAPAQPKNLSPAAPAQPGLDMGATARAVPAQGGARSPIRELGTP